jgi:hypothetical protein
MPGVNSMAGNVNGSLAQRGVQAVGGALVNTVASVSATIVENKINNRITGSNVPLANGMEDNTRVVATTRFISGVLTKPSGIPSESSQWYKDKQIIHHSLLRQGTREVFNLSRDEAVGRVVRRIIEQVKYDSVL